MKLNKVCLAFNVILGIGLCFACDNTQSSSITSSHMSSSSITNTSVSSSKEEETSNSVSSIEKEAFRVTTDVVDGYTSQVVNDETIYTFTKSGDYVISGYLKGKLLFDSSLITLSSKLFLNNVTIESTSQCIFWQSESKKIELSPLENTNNYLFNTGIESTVESNNNIAISGSGNLKINSAKHALDGSDITISETVNLDIEVSKDAFHGKQIFIEGGNTSIKNSDDAFQVEVNSKGNKGLFSMTGGNVTIDNCNSAVKADTSISITAGNMIITNCKSVFIPCINTPTISVVSGTTTIDGVDYTSLSL